MRVRANSSLVVCVAMLSASVVTVLGQSSLSDFGVDERALKTRIVSSLVYGSIPLYPDTKTFKGAPPARQAAFVKNALGWVKAYCESAAFKAEYQKRRESAKPTPPTSKGTPDEQFAKYLAEQRKGLEELKQNVAKMPPEMQKQMQGAVKAMEANIERSAKDPQMVAMMKRSYADTANSDQKDYENRLAAYRKEYPADPRALIAARLHQFLDLSQSVAFDAKLVPGRGGKMMFADAQYEAKSNEWKLCFRAGRVAVQAAQAFATEWLRQIEGK